MRRKIFNKTLVEEYDETKTILDFLSMILMYEAVVKASSSESGNLRLGLPVNPEVLKLSAAPLPVCVALSQ